VKYLLAFIFGSLFFLCIFNKANNLSDLDINQINTRRSYYPNLIGRYYQNKITHSFILVKKSLFGIKHE